MLPLDYINGKKEGDFIALDFDKYCKGNLDDVFACHSSKPFQNSYINFFVNKEKKNIFQFAEYYTKPNSEISKVVTEYKDRLLKKKTKCAGGLLQNKDQTKFIFALVAEGEKTSSSEIYNILNKISNRENMEFVYKCEN